MFNPRTQDKNIAKLLQKEEMTGVIEHIEKEKINKKESCQN